MTPAELQTLRQSLFLSEAQAAALGGATPAQLRAWEAPGGPPAPAALQRELRRLDGLVEVMARRIAAALAAQLGDSKGPQAVETVLLRHADDRDLAALDPEAVQSLRGDLGLAATLQAAALARCRRLAAEASGGALSLRLVWFDAEAYAAWLPDSGLEDGPAARLAWAAETLERSEREAGG